MKIIILLLCVFLSTNASASTKNDLAKSNNSFATRLYKEFRLSNTNENIFFSPYSIYTAMGMTYLGATESTKKEFETTLHIEPDVNIHDAIKDLNRSLVKDKPSLLDHAKVLLGDDAYQFSIANALWVKPDFPIEQAFVETLADKYNAEARNELSVDAINEWVAEKTNDKITHLLKPNDVPNNTVTILTNAAYFLGYWQQRFDKSSTSDQIFHGFNDEKKVPLMYQTIETHYSETDQYQSVSLNYDNSSLAMAVILPKDKGEKAFRTLEEELNAAFLNELLSKQTKQEVQLYLPRFKMKIPSRLKKPLSDIGMLQSFTPKASFCGIYADCASNPIWINNVVHEAFIKVDEAGTEAAAATAVIMVQEIAMPINKNFRADRPFIYFIYDKETGVILFMGSLLKV